MKLEGWKAMEAAYNRRIAREQWQDADEYEKALENSKQGLINHAPARIRIRTRKGDNV